MFGIKKVLEVIIVVGIGLVISDFLFLGWTIILVLVFRCKDWMSW